MSLATYRTPLQRAQDLARALMRDLIPACQKIAVAGSIRRQAQDVGDIELVAIPAERSKLLLGRPACPLDEVLEQFERDGNFERRKWGPKFKQFWLPHSSLGLFVCTPATWGCCLAIRTGPAEFSKRLVTKRCLGGLCPSHLAVRDLRVVEDTSGRPIETPEEEDVFRVLNVPFIEPSQRR